MYVCALTCVCVQVCVHEYMLTHVHMYIYFLHLVLIPQREFTKHHLLCETIIETTTSWKLNFIPLRKDRLLCLALGCFMGRGWRRVCPEGGAGCGQGGDTYRLAEVARAGVHALKPLAVAAAPTSVDGHTWRFKEGVCGSSKLLPHIYTHLTWHALSLSPLIINTCES